MNFLANPINTFLFKLAKANSVVSNKNSTIYTFAYLVFTTIFMSSYYYPHLTVKKTVRLWGSVTCPRFSSKHMAEPRFESRTISFPNPCHVHNSIITSQRQRPEWASVISIWHGYLQTEFSTMDPVILHSNSGLHCTRCESSQWESSIKRLECCLQSMPRTGKDESLEPVGHPSPA